jgi:type III pantothenate kinase
MIIAIDIGNSSINIGFFYNSALFVKRLDTKQLMPSSDYAELLDSVKREINIDKLPVGSIISSVVPSFINTWRDTLKRFIAGEPLVVNYKMNTGLTFDIPNPEQLGSDRIANAVAACEIYNCPVAAVDCGTATTISITGTKKNYIGGAIIPGIRLMNESLARETSTLTEIPLTPPESALGIDTRKCIQSGLFYGTAGAIEKILNEIEKSAGFKLKVVVTGGYGGIIHNFLKRTHALNPHLTLEGLKILYTRNTNE